MLSVSDDSYSTLEELLAHPDIKRYHFDRNLVARIHAQTLEVINDTSFDDIKGLKDIEKRVREIVQGPLNHPDIFKVR